MAENDNSKTIGEIDTKEKEFRTEIRVCVLMLFIALVGSLILIIIGNTKWIHITTYFELFLFVLILPFLEIFVKEKLVWLFIIRTIANFAVAVMLALPAMVSYIEQTQYLLLRNIGFAILIYFIYRSVDRIRRINYEKLTQFLAKHKVIKPRKGTINLSQISKDDLDLILNPITGFNFINKVLEKIHNSYFCIAMIILVSGGAAWGIILDRTVGFKIAVYIGVLMPYHFAFWLLSRAQLNYAMTRFIYKKQKELGKKLIRV